MRLGQLARQLDIKPEKIVSYLEKEKEITIKSHPNSKVDDDLIAGITDHFKPAVEEVEVAEEQTATKEEPAAVEEETKEELVEPEHIETVKPEAPQELKIVGKIDLPDKSQINVEVDGVVYDQETLDNKKKEELKEDRERKAIEKEAKRKEEEEKKAKAREQRKIEQERQAMLETEKNNILTQEEEKKKAAIIKAQQDRERKLEEKRKARQAAHYAEQFTAKSSSPKKKKAEAVTEKEEAIVDNSITPNTATTVDVETEKENLNGFQKFIKWLNT